MLSSKFKNFNGKLPSQVKDADELNNFLNCVQRELKDIHTALSDMYHTYTIQYTYTSNKELAAICCEAEGAVVSLLKKIELFSEFCLNINNNGYIDILNFIKKLSDALMEITNIGKDFLIKLKEVFKSFADDFSKVVLPHLKYTSKV